MTQNQIAHRRAEIEADKHEEQVRHNKKTEGIETMKAIFGKQGVMGVPGTIVGLGGKNDPSWYLNYPSLVRDGANLSFTQPASGSLGTTSRSNALTFDWVPTFGKLTGTDADPISLAAVTIYSKIRSAISGSRPYDRNDVMQVLLAISNIYTMTAELIRLYGIARWTSTINPVYRNVVGILGFNTNTVFTSLSDLRYSINLILSKLAGLPVPSSIPYFSRHLWLAGSVFKDTEQPKHKLYMFRLLKYWKYQWDESRCELIDTPLGESGSDLDWATYAQLINQEIDALLNYEDVAIILGDIRRAYEGDIATLTTIDNDYMVTPVCDDEILTQIEGISILGKPFETYYLSQSGTNLIYSNESNDQVDFALQYAVVNTDNETVATNSQYSTTLYNEVDYYHEEDVRPENNMVATRFMLNTTAYVEIDDMITIKSVIEDMGSEVICDAQVWSVGEGLSARTFHTFLPYGSSHIAGVKDVLPEVIQFRVSPKLFIIGSSPKLVNWQPHYNAKVDYNALENMHRTALMSQLVISPYPPASATYSRQTTNMQPSSYKGSQSKGGRKRKGKKDKELKDRIETK